MSELQCLAIVQSYIQRRGEWHMCAYIHTYTKVSSRENEKIVDSSLPPFSSSPSPGFGRASSKEKYGTLSIFELTTISEHSCTNVFQYKQSPGEFPWAHSSAAAVISGRRDGDAFVCERDPECPRSRNATRFDSSLTSLLLLLLLLARLSARLAATLPFLRMPARTLNVSKKERKKESK